MNPKTTSLLVLLAGALLGSGCAKESGSLEAVQICAMTDDCTFGATCDLFHMGEVEYNSAGAEWLQFPVEMRNQLADNANDLLGRVNTNDAHITGYILEFDGNGPSGMTLDVGHHTVPAGGSSLVWVYAAPPGAAVGNYTVSITFFGYYDNDREFETPPFPVALRVNNSFVAGCVAPEVLSCGSPQQNLFACK